MDPIREAFSKVKKEMDDLRDSFTEVQSDLNEIKRTLNHLLDSLNRQTDQQTNTSIYQTNQQATPTDFVESSQNMPLYGLKRPDSMVSIGNRGVPTDRQTDQQTNRQTDFEHKNRLSSASNLLSEVDSLKEEVRLKFNSLTHQEFIVFTTLYTLEESGQRVDYSLLAEKLNLSESSIRDYTLKIIRKGIPLTKAKENNKKVYLSIDTSIKKIISLATLMKLREI